MAEVDERLVAEVQYGSWPLVPPESEPPPPQSVPVPEMRPLVSTCKHWVEPEMVGIDTPPLEAILK